MESSVLASPPWLCRSRHSPGRFLGAAAGTLREGELCEFFPASSGPLNSLHTSADKHGFNTALGNNPAKEELYPLLEFSLEKIAKAPHEMRTPRVAVKEYVK